jgi:hypothetical protein
MIPVKITTVDTRYDRLDSERTADMFLDWARVHGRIRVSDVSRFLQDVFGLELDEWELFLAHSIFKKALHKAPLTESCWVRYPSREFFVQLNDPDRWNGRIWDAAESRIDSDYNWEYRFCFENVEDVVTFQMLFSTSHVA